MPVGRRWIGLLSLANLGMWIALLTPIQLLLPAQLDVIDPAGKVASLAWVTGIGAAVAILASPVVGMLSDRTTSRFGRRHPWVLGGAVLGAAALYAVGLQTSVIGLVLAWAGVQACLNAMLAGLVAVVPDQVPVDQRGVVSAWAGFPQAAGVVVGVVLATTIFTGAQAGYAAMALGVVLCGLPFVLFTPDPQVRDARPTGWRAFWVNPREHPDFGWAWACRLLVQLGNTLATVFLYFFLTDAVGSTDPENGLLVLTVIFTAAAVLACLLAGRASDRSGRRKSFVWACSVLQALAALVLVISPTWEAAIVGAVLLGAGFGAFLSVDQALITQVLPSADDRAKHLGVFTIANSLPFVLAPALGALIINYLGGYTGLYLAAFVIMVAGAACVFPIRSVR